MQRLSSPGGSVSDAVDELMNGLAAFGRPFVLVANLPYQAATPLMATLLERHPECRGQFVTIQREVGDRLRAQPHSGEYGPLTIMVQAFCEVEQIAVLPPGCFWPPPDVTSAMVAIPALRDDPPSLHRARNSRAAAPAAHKALTARRARNSQPSHSHASGAKISGCSGVWR